jgi:transcriptional regulator with XRE-family HTH domain
MRLGKKLYQIRARLGKSQRQMLDLIGLPDYHFAFVSMWERGLREPPLIALLRYARSVGASTDTLIDDDLDLALDNDATNRPSKKKKSRRKTT